MNQYMDWTPEEQISLDNLLQQYPAEKFISSLQRYVQIASHIPGKSVRELAMRIAWKTKRESSRKRKVEEAQTKRAKQKSEREPRGQSIFSVGARPPLPNNAAVSMQADPSPSSMGMGLQGPMSAAMSQLPPLHGSVQMNTQQFAALIPQLEDHGSDTVGNLGGATSQLLEQNISLINHVRSNWANCRIHETGHQLSQFRDNILKILNSMSVMPGKMTQMPPLPVKLNIELASHILPISKQ